jgi:2-polyprenyl-6-methoxyphenol hydroxylase-like FAD-dependent oxidoreductase
VCEVLIVGAGPTGLTMAAQLRAHGVEPRLVERRRERGPSRAFVVHPRTLELLAGTGLAPALVAAGDPAARVELHVGGRTAGVELAPSGHAGTSYPFLLFIPQSSVEDVLTTHLRAAGVEVERGKELVRATARRDAVEFVLHGDDGRVEEGVADYVIGCDGVDSTVRREAGITFDSRVYRPSLLLADLAVDGDLPDDRLHGFVAGPGVLFLFPSPSGAGWRLLTVCPPGQTSRGGRTDADGAAELQAVIDDFAGGALRVHPPDWLTHVRLRRGQADRYRRGRILLAGDAAHVHSPAGAQGMNTGIHDACNLAWKLALVVRGRSPSVLLDSYETERWPVARRTRQLTDLAFLLEAADHAPVRWLRAHATPLVLPLVRERSVPSGAFRLLGGLSTRYRRSPIVQEGVPRLRRGPHAGDRLPDGHVVHDGVAGSLHELLRPPVHHLLLCGPPGSFPAGTLERHRQEWRIPLRVHRVSWAAPDDEVLDPDGRLLRRLGVRGSGIYLVRPDGYIAYRASGTDLDAVSRYLREPGRWPSNT